MKVLIVHRHEAHEGSTILAVVPATKRGNRLAEKIKKKEQNSPHFMSCDVVEIEEREIEGMPKKKRSRSLYERIS